MGRVFISTGSIPRAASHIDMRRSLGDSLSKIGILKSDYSAVKHINPIINNLVMIFCGIKVGSFPGQHHLGRTASHPVFLHHTPKRHGHSVVQSELQ